MNKVLVNFLCCFIPSKEKRKAFRNRHILWKNNINNHSQVSFFKDNLIYEKNHIEIDNEDRKKINLKIIGENNNVIINKLGNVKNLTISIAGNNCSVIIEDGVRWSHSLSITLGQKHRNFGLIDNAKCRIGKNTSFEQAKIITFNSNSLIEIGENCMFAYGITLFHTDAHPILDYESKKIINKVRKMQIGNHCWVGAHASIMKNVIIPDDCIVGWGSVVGSSINKHIEPHCAIAGNPAVVVKKGITWDSNGSNGYVQNEPE